VKNVGALVAFSTLDSLARGLVILVARTPLNTP